MNYRHRLLIRSRPVLRFVKFRLLHVDDSPQRMARGIAAGLFVAYLPLLGLHIPLSFLAGLILRGNKMLALVAVWFCNPLTFFPIYYPCYRLGRIIVAFFHKTPEVQLEKIQSLLYETFSLQHMLTNLFSAHYWKQVGQVFAKVGLETLVGGVILGILVAFIGYWISYYFIIGYQTRKQMRKDAWKQAQTE